MSMFGALSNRQVVSSLRTIVRNAGGGGRPGGKPAFNWKEKKLLNLNVKRKVFKPRPYGDWDDLKEFFDPKVDVMLPFEQEDQSFDDPAFAGKLRMTSDKKRINVRSLYGSRKPFGIIPRKERPEGLTFSYERVFGEKHRAKAAAAAATAAASAKQ